jgi:VanZ family protein
MHEKRLLRRLWRRRGAACTKRRGRVAPGAAARLALLVALAVSSVLVVNFALLDSARLPSFLERMLPFGAAPFFHVLGFCALTVPAAIVWPHERGRVVGALLAAAAGIEVVQIFFPSRSASLPDLLWSGLGIVAGMMASRVLGGVRRIR